MPLIWGVRGFGYVLFAHGVICAKCECQTPASCKPVTQNVAAKRADAMSTGSMFTARFIS